MQRVGAVAVAAAAAAAAPAMRRAGARATRMRTRPLGGVRVARCLLALAALAAALRPGAGERLASCELDSDLLASLRNELAQWRHNGIDVQHMRDLSKVCPEWQDDFERHCAGRYQRFTIDNNEVFLNSLPPRPVDKGHAPPVWVVPGTLLELYETAHKYQLPNVDLAIAFGDHAPWEGIGDGPESVQHRATPILSFFSSRKAVSVIRVPDAGRYRCEKDGVDRLLAKQALLTSDPLWQSRYEVAFARDTPFCSYCSHEVEMEDGNTRPQCVRTHLEALSNQYPELLHAGTGHFPLIDFRKYKYLVASDGLGPTAKYEKFLLMGSLVLKTRSRCFGWFYDTMKPYKHYVPVFVKHENDTVDVIKWLREHQEEAAAIAKAGTERASKIFSKESRLCFWKTLIDEIARLQTYVPSCRLHKMCVPLKTELDYMGNYEYAENPCNVHDTLDEIHGHKVDHGPNRSDWGEAWGTFQNASHGYLGWYMHEEDLDLLPHETVADWKPPEWAADWVPLDWQI